LDDDGPESPAFAADAEAEAAQEPDDPRLLAMQTRDLYVAKTVCGGVRLLHLSDDTLQDLQEFWDDPKQLAAHLPVGIVLDFELQCPDATPMDPVYEVLIPRAYPEMAPVFRLVRWPHTFNARGFMDHLTRAITEAFKEWKENPEQNMLLTLVTFIHAHEAAYRVPGAVFPTVAGIPASLPLTSGCPGRHRILTGTDPPPPVPVPPVQPTPPAPVSIPELTSRKGKEVATTPCPRAPSPYPPVADDEEIAQQVADAEGLWRRGGDGGPGTTPETVPHPAESADPRTGDAFAGRHILALDVWAFQGGNRLLRRAFAQFNPIQCQVVRSGDAKHIGFGAVEFQSSKDLRAAIAEMDGTILNRGRLTCRFATEEDLAQLPPSWRTSPGSNLL